MGMFDEVICHYPLPWPEVQDAIWHSKNTPAQYLERYEIRADGTLWHEAYTERFEKDASSPFGFHLYRDDVHWVQVSGFCGELEIYTSVKRADHPGAQWYSVRFWFRDGTVKDMISSREATHG